MPACTCMSSPKLELIFVREWLLYHYNSLTQAYGYLFQWLGPHIGDAIIIPIKETEEPLDTVMVISNYNYLFLYNILLTIMSRKNVVHLMSHEVVEGV